MQSCNTCATVRLSNPEDHQAPCTVTTIAYHLAGAGEETFLPHAHRFIAEVPGSLPVSFAHAFLCAPFAANILNWVTPCMCRLFVLGA